MREDGREQAVLTNRSSQPVWAVPFLLVLAGLIAWVGRLPQAVIGLVLAEVVVLCGYMIHRARSGPAKVRPVSNLPALLPGHLLVLLMIALLDDPGWLGWLWTVIPAATLAYDLVGHAAALAARWRMSISIALYVILWGDLFFLLERAVVLHRELQGNQAIAMFATFGLVGALFLSVGVYRHWRVVKE